MKVECRIDNPTVQGQRFDERWNGPDHGLICCWLRGIAKAKESPALADKAKAGELPVLAWKGGVEKAIKSGAKFGSLNYLATWQGLRGEDLCVDLDRDAQLTCSRTGVTVVFLPAAQLLLTAEEA